MNYKILDSLTERYPSLENLKERITSAALEIIACYQQEGKLLICGNGGSCADSDHITGELMKSFEMKRPPDLAFKEELIRISPERGAWLAANIAKGLPAISLNAHGALISAISNDCGPNLVYAQQVAGYGRKNDILLALTTSGNSSNVIDAAITAKAMGLKVIGLTGGSGGCIKEFCDILINVPGSTPAFVQELHLPVYHTICRLVEEHFFGVDAY